MQGEALLKIGGILEKLSNDITILKNNSIETSKLSKQYKRPKLQNKKIVRPLLKSTSQRRKTSNKRVSFKKKQVKRKSSTKKNNKRR